MTTPPGCRILPRKNGPAAGCAEAGGRDTSMDWNPKPLDISGVTVHRCGPKGGRGQPLVLLHCLGQSWRFWDVLEPLADRFELIAYSLPGHADTPLPEGQY